MHEEVFLNEQVGSKRENTWGINIYPGKSGEEMIEFDSMINIKPQYDNRSRGVGKAETRERIIMIVKKLIAYLWSLYIKIWQKRDGGNYLFVSS